MTHVPTILLTGRANVGKSTLFNRLVSTHRNHRKTLKPQAIVSEKAGATRDIISADIDWHGLHFRLSDGAGWSERPASALQKTVAAHSRKALENADIILFLYDAKAGLLPEDKALADFFRKTGIPILPVANKCEGMLADSLSGEAYALGFGEPIALSALQGDGLNLLYDVLSRHIMPVKEDEEETNGGDDRIRICILGRPNVGKSTLVNRMLGEEKALVADMPGLTRDAVEYPLSYKGEEFLLFDTAGLRRRARVQENLEQLSVTSSLKALQYSDVAVLVIDADIGLQKQDLTLAKLIADEGRAPVFVLNKWDLVQDKKTRLRDFAERLESGFAQVKGVRIVPLSALKAKQNNLGDVWKAVKQSHAAWDKRVSTGLLNRWLQDCVSENPPPIESGRRLKIRYMTQAKTRPPTFILFASQAGKNKGDGALPTQYMRFLRNRLQKDFAMEGVPLRIRTARA